MYAPTINMNTIVFNALIVWALLTFLYDNYAAVSKVITSPTWRGRLLCPKCFALWVTLGFTQDILAALAVSFLISLYSKYINFTR
jgi:hypothetical protein